MCNGPQPPLGQSQQSLQFELWNQQVCGQHHPEPQESHELQSPQEPQSPQLLHVEQLEQLGPQPPPHESPPHGPQEDPH